jgi:hypothetical protein
MQYTRTVGTYSITRITRAQDRWHFIDFGILLAENIPKDPWAIHDAHVVNTMWHNVCWLLAKPVTTLPSYRNTEHKLNARHHDGHAEYEHDDEDVGEYECGYHDDDDDGEVDCVDD